jgi:hypothetical protein
MLAAFAAVSLGFAQRELPAVKVSNPPVIDGTVNEGEWASASVLSGGFDDETGAAPPFEQTFWLAYDERFIYIAARLQDPEPGKILAVETRMNVDIESEDHVIFAIDPFGNLQNLNEFKINARGATELDIAGGRAPKREWIGEILAAGRITEKGWECEARIPWAIMQLPGPGQRTIRADFGRYIQRTGRTYITSNVAGEQTQNITRWLGVQVPAAGTARTLKLLPYGYAGYSRHDSEVIMNSGLDLKTSLSDQLELIGTINPDFRNIENDVLSLDFSYFERLAGESRPFFLEGADFFQTSRDASLFASQRIHNFDTGLKVYGKVGDSTRVAFLNTMNFTHEAAWVANVSHQLRPRESFTIAGSYLEREGMSNGAQFLAYNKGIGNHFLFAQYSTTHDSAIGDGNRFNAGLSYEKDGVEGILEYQQISPDFLPRLGFAPKVGFKGWSGNLNWTIPHPSGPIRETGIGISARDEDDWEGRPFLRGVGMEAGVGLRNNFAAEFSAGYEEFEGFKDRQFQFELAYPYNDPYRRLGASYEWGNVAGEDFRLVGLDLRYRPLQRLQIRVSHEELWHVEHEKQSILSLNYELNAFDSVSSRLIRRDDDINVYFAWRRAGNRGVEYYLILGDPNARSFRESIILKAVVPFQIPLGR